MNINDCKLHEKVPKINRLYGPIDIFTAQFSGAIWHPVCYDLPEKEYQRISIEKKMSKFSMVANTIKTITPVFYLPSAGPPCFLDPMLMHINFEKINIFPRAPEFLSYLTKRCKNIKTVFPEIMPGDILDAETLQFIHLEKNRVVDSDIKNYILNYASEYTDYFQKRTIENNKVDAKQVFLDLKRDS